MKRLFFNLIAFAGIAVTISACNPMKKTYDEIGPVPTPNGTPQTFTLTLAAADYGLLPSDNYAKTKFSFKTGADAASGIPVILASKYANYADKSSAGVTYSLVPNSVAIPDTLYKDVAYTLKNDDYLKVEGNTYPDFDAATVIKFLGVMYNDPAANQLAVLTFTYFENGTTYPSTTQSFLFLNGAWKKIYTISPAQYTSIGKGGTYNDFSSGDRPNLQKYFNIFLKNDPAIAATAKAGDVQYVSYKLYAGDNYQPVLVLTFDGANWTTNAIPQTLSFVKTSGTWVADNTVTYSLAAADYTTIANIPGIASADAIDNLKQHGNFSLTGGTAWTDAQINTGIAAVLKAKYPSAAANQKFIITYSGYNGATISVTKTFVYDGSNFNLATS